MRLPCPTAALAIPSSIRNSEIFHELGYMDEISDYLTRAATSEEISAEDRFWALDGLVFAHFKDGDEADIQGKLDRMDELVRGTIWGSRNVLRWG